MHQQVVLTRQRTDTLGSDETPFRVRLRRLRTSTVAGIRELGRSRTATIGAVMIGFLLLTALTFCLFGFIVGIWAQNWEQLQVIPMLIVTPLTFLGGAFYSIDMLPEGWRTLALFNPIVYLVSGFRWSFYGQADVAVGISLSATLGFFAVCLLAVWWIFRTGYRLKQ